MQIRNVPVRTEKNILLNNVSIRQALGEWYSDPESATQKYGPIEYWNTKKVTDLEDLYLNMYFN